MMPQGGKRRKGELNIHGNWRMLSRVVQKPSGSPRRKSITTASICGSVSTETCWPVNLEGIFTTPKQAVGVGGWGSKRKTNFLKPH